MKPKTSIIFGAGFTASLKMPTSYQQEQRFKKIAFDHSSFEEDRKYVDEETIKHHFEIGDNGILELKQYISSYYSLDSFELQAFYNLLDLQIDSGLAYTVQNEEFKTADLIEIRNTVLKITQYWFGLATEEALDNSNEESQKNLRIYYNFFKEIAQSVVNDKLEQAKETKDLRDEDFIFSDISYISFNWDVILIWLMFNAHKDLNDSNKDHLVFDGKNLKLKIFNDFSTYLATKPLSTDPSFKKWFPYNEPVAFRVNDSEHLNKKVISLIRTYFPHGHTNWLECPRCGKLSMYLGDSWDLNSDSISMLNYKEKGPECLHCGHQLGLENSVMLLQTQYKKKSSFIQEIQTDMRLEIQNSDRLIFIGYSLPSDDIEYQSIFNALKHNENSNKKVYLLLYEEEYEKVDWLCAEDIPKTERSDTLNRYTDIFGKENVYYNGLGMPKGANLVLDLLKE